jgi:hypothetical protein
MGLSWSQDLDRGLDSFLLIFFHFILLHLNYWELDIVVFFFLSIGFLWLHYPCHGFDILILDDGGHFGCFFLFFFISSLILDCLRIECHSCFFFWQAFLCANCHDHFFFLIQSTCYCCFFSYHKIKWKPSYWTQLNL